MIKDFFKAVGQLPHRTFRHVLLIAALGAIGVMIVIWAGVYFTLAPLVDAFLTLSWLPWFDEVLNFILGSGLVFVVWFLFPPAMLAITGLLLDPIAKAVEDKHYPDLGPPRAVPLTETVIETVKFALVAVSLNVLLLLFLFSGPVYLVMYYLLNGYLLGREYFDVVAARRFNPTEAHALRKKHMPSLWLAGAGFTFLMKVPILNLIIPVLAVAYMVHYAVRVGAMPRQTRPPEQISQS